MRCDVSQATLSKAVRVFSEHRHGSILKMCHENLNTGVPFWPAHQHLDPVPVLVVGQHRLSCGVSNSERPFGQFLLPDIASTQADQDMKECRQRPGGSRVGKVMACLPDWVSTSQSCG